MRILILHNRYRWRGGEDLVVENEGQLLVKNGHKVEYLYFDNTELAKRPLWQRLFYTFANPVAKRRTKEAILRFRPDILHAHNVFYEATLAGIRVAQQMGIPTLMTLHNYRMGCIAGTLLRQNQICTLCLRPRWRWHGIRYRCFQKSRRKSAQLQLIITHHTKSQAFQNLKRLIVFTPFQKELLQRVLRIPEAKWVIKAHSTPDPNAQNLPQTNPTPKRKPFFLYVGRLSHEKGIPLLLAAFEEPLAPLVIMGDGPLAHLCVRAAQNPSITYLGPKDPNSVLLNLKQCQALLYASVGYETFGLTLIEALACATPIIAFQTPTIQHLIPTNAYIPVQAPYSTHKLRQAIQQFQALTPNTKANMQTKARQQYEKRFTQQRNYQQLIQIYQNILSQEKKS